MLSILLIISFIVIPFILYPIIYGLLVDTIMNKPKTSWNNLLRLHCFNYFALSTLLIIPAFVILMIYYCHLIDNITKFITMTIYGVLINCLSIYILPLVFLKHRVIYSIFAGIKIVLCTYYESIILILLSITSFLLNIVEISIIYSYHIDNLYACILIRFLLNLISVYVNLLVFTMATMILIEQGNDIIATIVNKTFKKQFQKI